MTITLFPEAQRIQLSEDNNEKLRNASENYTGIVFDTKENKFSIVTGKFRDKKDMYNKMTKQDKYLRRAYETKIFDWIQDNAETPVDGYLMLSTAVSKWVNNNVLSKYYKKLLHDLPYINREGRKGDPQTMGVKASFESAEDFHYEDVLNEDGYTIANLPEIEAGIRKNLDNEEVKYYTMRIAGLDFFGAPVYDDNNNIIGYVSPEYKDIERTSKKLNAEGQPETFVQRNYIVKDNNDDNIGYYQKKTGRVYDSLENGHIIGHTNENDFEEPEDYRNYITVNEPIPLLDFAIEPDTILQNPMFVVSALQAIQNNPRLKDNYGVFDIQLRDKYGNLEQTYRVKSSQLDGALRQAREFADGKRTSKDILAKVKGTAPMSREEQLAREVQQRQSAASNPSNPLHGNDMFGSIASTHSVSELQRKQLMNKLKWLEKSNIPSDITQAKEIRRVLGIAEPTEFSTDQMDRAQATVDTWKKMNTPAPQPTPQKDAVKIADAELEAEVENKDALSQARIMTFRAKRQEFGDDIAKTRAYYNENPEEYKADVKANIAEIEAGKTENPEKVANESVYDPHVNDGAASVMQWADSNPLSPAKIEEVSTNSELNQDLFDGKELKADVRQALLDIANAFKEDLKIDYEPVDIYFTGSEANYNYNEHSDIDVHLVYDFEHVGPTAEMINQYLQTAKKVFNNNHDIKVKGLPVEVGAEMKGTPLVTSGVYSLLNDSWVIEPENADKEIAEPTEPYYNEIKLRLEDAITSKDSGKIKDAIELIWGIRKEGLANEGEFGPSNTLFKRLRNEGILGDLRKAYYDAESEDLSLESMMNEAEFASKDSVKAEISNDLFDKSENEIVDGLMDHYEGNTDEAIAKVEDVIKTVSDGYKDKLQNVIQKIKECSTFSNRCRMIAEKVLKEQDEKTYGMIIKELGDKVASKFLKDQSGDFKKAIDNLESSFADEKYLLNDIEIEDDDKNRIENAGINAQQAIYKVAMDNLMQTMSNEKINSEISYGKSQRNFVPSPEVRQAKQQELEMPQEFLAKDFVNFYKDIAEIPGYLLGIREQIPLSILDHPFAFYVVDNEGKRIALKGIENNLYPKKVWVNELESKPTAPRDKIIATYNGNDIKDFNDNVIGYAKEDKAYTNDNKFIGYIDEFGNVFDPAYTTFRNQAVKAYAMPIEQYIDILHDPKNAETLKKAEARDPLLQKMGDEPAKQYNYLKGKADEVNTHKERWILSHVDDLKLDHYPVQIRNAIYNRVVKHHENIDDVMSDYKRMYKAEPVMRITPEVKAMYAPKEESINEDVITEDADYYTVNNNYRDVKNALNDMHIPVMTLKDVITDKSGDSRWGGMTKYYKLQGVLKNPNQNVKIIKFPYISDEEFADFKKAYLDDNGYVRKVGDNDKVQAIGFAPQQTLDQYVKQNKNMPKRFVFKFVDDDHKTMMPIGYIEGDDAVPMFKIMNVDKNGERLTKADNVAPAKPLTKAYMFNLLARPENELPEIMADVNAKADDNVGTKRDVINKNEKQAEYIPLNDAEIEQVLEIMSKRNPNSKYQDIYEQWQKDGENTSEVVKALRAFDPNFAEYIRKLPDGSVRLHLAYLDTDQRPHQFKKSALDKLVGK